jgi:hypothetical protein
MKYFLALYVQADIGPQFTPIIKILLELPANRLKFLRTMSTNWFSRPRTIGI